MASATVTNIYYIIKSGDTLTSIAKKFSTTTNQLLIWNPKITDPNKIYAGSEIKIGQKDIKPIPTTIQVEPTETPKVIPSNIPSSEPTITTTKTTVIDNYSSFYMYGIGIIAILFLLNKKGQTKK
jgi:LysM repeat protein